MKKLIVALAMVILLAGCNEKPLPEEPGHLVKVDEFYITIEVNPPCPEGFERVNQTIYGIHRGGCYPIDFDYETANDRLGEYLAKEGLKP